jgi:PadR family transcriptional regulator
MTTLPNFQNELKKGTAEVLILALLEQRPRHGYEIAKLIEQRSEGVLEFHVASLYPMLYRLEKRGWIEGRWLEKEGTRRRRYYKLTPEGRAVLPEQRRTWREFIRAIKRVAQVGNA